MPWRRYRARREEGAPDSGALHHYGIGDCRTRFHIVEGESQRIADAACDRKLIGFGVYERNVEVDQQVMYPNRGNRIAEPLQVHPVVPEGEPHLFAGELLAGSDLGHLGDFFPSARKTRWVNLCAPCCHPARSCASPDGLVSETVSRVSSEVR